MPHNVEKGDRQHPIWLLPLLTNAGIASQFTITIDKAPTPPATVTVPYFAISAA